jgi:hypothetical protein
VTNEWVPTAEVRVFQITVDYQPPLDVSAVLYESVGSVESVER